MATGLQLKMERIQARRTGRAVAARMGVNPQRLSTIESSAVVTDTAAARYRAALHELDTEAPDVPTR